MNGVCTPSMCGRTYLSCLFDLHGALSCCWLLVCIHADAVLTGRQGKMLQLTLWTKRAGKAAVLPRKQVARRPSRAPDVARSRPAQ